MIKVTPNIKQSIQKFKTFQKNSKVDQKGTTIRRDIKIYVDNFYD